MSTSAESWRCICVKKALLWSWSDRGAKRPWRHSSCTPPQGKKKYYLVTDPDLSTHSPTLCFLRHLHSHVVHKCACSTGFPQQCSPVSSHGSVPLHLPLTRRIWEVPSTMTASMQVGEPWFLKELSLEVAAELCFAPTTSAESLQCTEQEIKANLPQILEE